MMDSLALLGNDASSEIVRIRATLNIDGMLVKEINDEKFKLISIVRGESSFLPKDDDVIETNDILYFIIKTEAKRKLKILLGI